MKKKMMKETKKEQLKKEIWEMCGILFLAQENLKVIKYLQAPEDDDDTSYVKTVNAIFPFIKINLWRIVVLELAKLFHDSEGEHYNIHKIIAKLEKSGHYGDANISEKNIKDWKEGIAQNELTIQNLKDQRDKLYAHQDKDFAKYENKVSISKALELVSLTQSIVKEIYSSVFESAFMVDSPLNAPVDNLKYVISELADKKKILKEAWRPIAKEYGLEDELK